MLRRANDFKKLKLRARDGDIGSPKEFYFDDRYWAVRYLVAETGGWMSDKQVLISPYALKPVIYAEQVLPVNLTIKQIEGSPSLETNQPVSRQYEDDYYGYYGWPYYGYGTNMWGASPFLLRDPASWQERALARREEEWDPNLRSTHDVDGHHIQALDGEIGHVSDFIIDDETWSIRYLVVDTKNWWPGRHVLIAPSWIERVSWEESKVFVNLTRDSIEQAPAYEPEVLNREYESNLYNHYSSEGYWAHSQTVNEANANINKGGKASLK